jgi:hypothetical protein
LENISLLDKLFDDLLFQTLRGKVTHEQLEQGIRFDQFEQVKSWKQNYGYRFNIYSNDHLIDGKKHFHFNNESENIFCKIDFNGNILETNNPDSVSSKILKELRYFLSKDNTRKLIEEMWDLKNPESIQEIKK